MICYSFFNHMHLNSLFSNCKKMDERLYKATIEGNTEWLVKLVKQDPLILDRINTTTTSYLETPLHIAAMLGHENFAVELLKTKPALARELDSRRSSPLHVASAKGHVAIVKALLRVDPDACLVRDREGRNPVHVAAMMGRVGVLREMLEAKPEAARVVLTSGTVLHLCVEYNQFEALKMVMESVDFKDLVNNKDKYGNTVLHLAVADKQVETTQFLLSSPKMDLNAVNHSGITAMDILIQRRRDARDLEMEESLKQAGAIEGNINSFSLRIKEKPDRHRSRRNTNKKRNNNRNDWLDKKRSALMVVASLIATMAFQVGVNPPGKIWDESPTSNATQPFTIRNPLYSVRKAGEFLKKGERFYIINTVSFIASLTIILLLMSGLPLNSRFFVWVLLLITWIAISVIALSYTVAVMLITPSSKETEIYAMVGVTVFVWICVMTLLVLGHTLRLFVMVLKMLLKMLKLLIKPLFPTRRRNSAAYTPHNARV